MRIWLVDDDSLTNMIHKAVVKRHNPNWEVVVFEKAQHALDQLREITASPDAILLDLNMPVMNGWQFLEKYEEMGGTSPIYVVSSSVDEVDIVRADAFSCVNSYFVKPLRVAYLQKVEQLIQTLQKI